MQKKHKRAILAFFIIAIALGFYSFGRFLPVRESAEATANSNLYNLDVALSLLEHWEKNYKEDLSFEKDIKHLILNELFMLPYLNPRIEDLQGVPLEALNNFILYWKKNDLTIDGKTVLPDYVSNYLRNIENEVVKTKSERDEIMRKPFKKEIMNKIKNSHQ